MEKFNKLYTQIKESLDDNNGISDIYNAILTVYKINQNKTLYKIYEIINFKYHDPDRVIDDQLDDLIFDGDETDISADDPQEYVKIIIKDKQTGKNLFVGITLNGTDLEDVIELLSADKNPLGKFTRCSGTTSYRRFFSF